MADTIDLDSFRRGRPALFRDPEAMAALRLADHVGDQLAASGGSLTIGPALERLCAVVPADDEVEFEIPAGSKLIDLQAVRDGMEVSPEPPHRMAGWTTLALIILTLGYFALRILLPSETSQ